MYGSDCKDFQAKFQQYIGILKKDDNLEVGITVSATGLIDMSSAGESNSKSVKGSSCKCLFE